MLGNGFFLIKQGFEGTISGKVSERKRYLGEALPLSSVPSIKSRKLWFLGGQ